MHGKFTKSTQKEAAKIPLSVGKDALKGRTDFRGQECITIDGADAKDLDDAVYLEPAGSGWRLYVHIADVAYYVPRGGAIDKEAYLRGTSVYLADSVQPMLPVELSNGICSLNAGEDRLAMTCVLDFDEYGKVLRSKLCESVIRVKRRMTYDEVMGILESAEGASMIFLMRELAERLNANRLARGAIALSSSECRFETDENGHPVEVIRVESTEATSIIEEFMIICNETVAETMKKAKMPFLYRVHDASPSEKLDRLFGLAHVLGIKKKKHFTAKKRKGTQRRQKAQQISYSSKSVQALIEKAAGTAFEDIINRAALGCMQQAVYSRRNLGHYGLASDYYCHFTAPIRRYPDLFCHRMVKAFLRGGLEPSEKSEIRRGLAEAARHLSVMERRAAEAERDMDNLMKAKYMSDKLGRAYTGRISGVTRWGIYVELENTVEGLVAYSDMQDDYYIADEANFRAVGERRRKVYRLGDTLRVCAVSTDCEKRHVNFVIMPN